MLKYSPLLLFIWLGVQGCGTVQTSELAGTWVVTEQTRQDILPASEQSSVTRIVLESNGTFSAYDLPGELLYAPPKFTGHLVSGSGTWKLEQLEGRHRVLLKFHTIETGELSYLYDAPLTVSKGLSGIRLYFFQGDPDEGRRVELEKSSRCTRTKNGAN